ncbi:hypothetical protein C2857_005558 [Epichloe festucae Fl1]|uniref:Peroxin/Ferlin domain-containing protein n=1 Tax=Epichloe festucae (strain Fl1) TaxID=877507 RepID=A0A7S9KL54_EPIFF|nr:hypothetical protein C2857_005558 [Epichloe festucae Fl1]
MSLTACKRRPASPPPPPPPQPFGAIDSPWLSHLDLPMSSRDDASSASTYESQGTTGPPSTHASFSPVTLSANTTRSARRSNILVHLKSPLLLATPPQVTRALAYSHPFLLPLNKFLGLLTWSTGDPWQSFLLLSAFWFIVLYGDVVVRRAGPVVIGMAIIAGMYGRRYSPLSSSGWADPARPHNDASSNAGAASSADAQGDHANANKHPRASSENTSTKHQKTLDEIVETLKVLTGRCNVLMEPLLEMTDFLSTQRTPTSATTKPALTAMFVRLLVVTPFWLALTMPPFHVITTRRVVLVFGTIILTWHARPMRVTRTLLWRSSFIRKSAAAVTGLRFHGPTKSGHRLAVEAAKGQAKANSSCSGNKKSRNKSSGVKFTFIIYENQRRWVGLGWTASLFAYERPAWTDEHNNPVPSKDDFELPNVEDGSRMRWQWVEGSRWRVDGVADDKEPVDHDGEEGRNGWIYYDNKWQHGRRGQDGWAKWTRRRKWYRDAELVEVDELDLPQPGENGSPKSSETAHERTYYSTAGEKMVPTRGEPDITAPSDPPATDDDGASILSTSSKSSFWPSLRRRAADKPPTSAEKEQPKSSPGEAAPDDDATGLDLETELELQQEGKDGGRWGIGDDARMNLE